MAICIRFPSGLSLTYNMAHWVRWDADSKGATLYTKENGDFVAKVINGTECVVEFVEPCRISIGLTESKQLEDLIRNIRIVDKWRLCELKRALRDFSTRHRIWK